MKTNKILIIAIIIGVVLIAVSLWIILPVGDSEEDSVNEICSCDLDLDCGDFVTQEDAQACFEYCGGMENDVHDLDRNNDGVVCESLG